MVDIIGSGSNSMRHDRTRADIMRHIDGLRLEVFEISMAKGFNPPNTVLKSRSEFLLAISDYIRMNAQGMRIYIDGPKYADHDVIRVSGTGRHQFGALADAGFQPAVVVQLGLDRYDAWIRLGQPAGARVRSTIAAHLCETFGLSSEGGGLLAGLKNREQKARFHRGYDAATILSASGSQASAGPELVQAAEMWLAEVVGQPAVSQSALPESPVQPIPPPMA
jgi:hypothetical protein